MTARQLITELQKQPNLDVETGFYDGEGHWCKVTYLKSAMVDESNWTPRGSEQQTGSLRLVLELSDTLL